MCPLGYKLLMILLKVDQKSQETTSSIEIYKFSYF